MKRTPRGTSIIEAMVAMSVLLVGLLGFASLQVIGARTNTFARRMSQATTMAVDLEENVKRWAYTDTRLATTTVVTTMSDSTITSKWDLGLGTATPYTLQYSDKATTDTNATTSNALGNTYQGLRSSVDADGNQERYTRYWNVYEVNLSGTPQPNGKFVQIIVRWFEPGLGFRQVTTSAFKPNPQYALQ